MGARFYGSAASQIQPAWSLVHWMFHDVAILFVRRLMFSCIHVKEFIDFLNFRSAIFKNLLVPTKLGYKLTRTVHEEVMVRKFTRSSLSCVFPLGFQLVPFGTKARCLVVTKTISQNQLIFQN